MLRSFNQRHFFTDPVDYGQHKDIQIHELLTQALKVKMSPTLSINSSLCDFTSRLIGMSLNSSNTFLRRGIFLSSQVAVNICPTMKTKILSRGTFDLKHRKFPLPKQLERL